jgi:hypothetical protein
MAARLRRAAAKHSRAADFVRREAASASDVWPYMGEGDKGAALVAAVNRAVRREERNRLFLDNGEHPRRPCVVPLELALQVPLPNSPAAAIQDGEPQPHSVLMARGHAHVADDIGRDPAANLYLCLELFSLAGWEGRRADRLLCHCCGLITLILIEPGPESVHACEEEQDEHSPDEKHAQAGAEQAPASAQKAVERRHTSDCSPAADLLQGSAQALPVRAAEQLRQGGASAASSNRPVAAADFTRLRA